MDLRRLLPRRAREDAPAAADAGGAPVALSIHLQGEGRADESDRQLLHEVAQAVTVVRLPSPD